MKTTKLAVLAVALAFAGSAFADHKNGHPAGKCAKSKCAKKEVVAPAPEAKCAKTEAPAPEAKCAKEAK